MQFKEGQKFFWEGKHWEIRLNDQRTLTIRNVATKQSEIVDQSVLERAIMNRCLHFPKTEPDVEQKKNRHVFSELNDYQRGVILNRLKFVNRYQVGDVTIFNEEEIVVELAKELNVKKPGKSTVRKWLQKYLEAGKDPTVLTDNRSPLYK